MAGAHIFCILLFPGTHIYAEILVIDFYMGCCFVAGNGYTVEYHTLIYYEVNWEAA